MRPKLIMMSGVPGSGKSTIAEEIAKKIDAVIISSDKTREKMFGDANIQGDPADIFKEVREKTIQELQKGNNVIIDSTNLAKSRRAKFLAMINKSHIDCEKICFNVKASLKECIERQTKRERQVPIEKIKRQFYTKWDPTYEEGWDKIFVSENGKTKHIAQEQNEKEISDEIER